MADTGFFCPEIIHPGQTGCKFNALAERVENIETIANGHTITLTRLEAYGQATAFWAKFAAWLVGVLIALAVAYFASLEARGKIIVLHPPPTIKGEVLHAHNTQREANFNKIYAVR